MTRPDQDHPITLTRSQDHVRVSVGGREIADTRRALVLKEAGRPPVFYIPRADADMDRLHRTAHHTSCPYKGRADHFDVEGRDGRVENAVWTYETPNDALVEIQGHLAFYPDKATIEVEPRR